MALWRCRLLRKYLIKFKILIQITKEPRLAPNTIRTNLVVSKEGGQWVPAMGRGECMGESGGGGI